MIVVFFYFKLISGSVSISEKIRVLNFDDSLIQQRKLLAEYDAEVVDLRDIAPRARFWMDEETKKEIAVRVNGFSNGGITFLGSGDFHHVSSILIDSISEPVTVINIDQHPDWSVFPGKLCCGSWVTETLKNGLVKKVLLLGASSGSAIGFSTQMGNYSALENDRVEIYPWRQCPSKVFFRKIPRNKSIKTEPHGIFTKIYWDELKEKNLTEFLRGVFKSFPTKRVYVSIDKDCLQRKDSLTNWAEGAIPLDDLLSMLRVIRHELEVVGVDVAGDYSESFVQGAIKNIVSKFNHPKEYSAKGCPASDIARVNENTNLELIKVLTEQEGGRDPGSL
ncbi:MAG: hypothetical protein ISS33_00080 [Candidatus Omnitrophica bacterium]|nr:hypothetical protein [Candidatus Omnitrophota bacterium]